VTAENSFFIIKKTLCGWNFNAQQKRSEVISGGVYCVLHHSSRHMFLLSYHGHNQTARPPPRLPAFSRVDKFHDENVITMLLFYFVCDNKYSVTHFAFSFGLSDVMKGLLL
jgi:hypothetical protein